MSLLKFGGLMYYEGQPLVYDYYYGSIGLLYAFKVDLMSSNSNSQVTAKH